MKPDTRPSRKLPQLELLLPSQGRWTAELQARLPKARLGVGREGILVLLRLARPPSSLGLLLFQPKTGPRSNSFQIRTIGKQKPPRGLVERVYQGIQKWIASMAPAERALVKRLLVKGADGLREQMQELDLSETLLGPASRWPRSKVGNPASEAAFASIFRSYLQGIPSEHLLEDIAQASAQTKELAQLRAMGALSAELGDHQLAARCLTQALRHAPSYFHGWLAAPIYGELLAADLETEAEAFRQRAQRFDFPPQSRIFLHHAMEAGKLQLASRLCAELPPSQSGRDQAIRSSLRRWVGDLSGALEACAGPTTSDQADVEEARWMALGLQAKGNGDWERARSCLNKARRKDRDESRIDLWLAETERSAGNPKEAAKWLAKASPHTTHPAEAILGVLMGIEQGELDHGRVVEFWDYTWEFDGFLNRGLPALVSPQEVLTAQRTKEGAIEVFKEALRRLGGNRSRIASVVTSTQQGPQLDIYKPKAGARETSAEALRALRNVGLSQTHQALTEAVVAFPDSPHPHCYLGELYLWEGKLEKAYRAFSSALARTQARWAYIGKAAIHLLRGESREAHDQIQLCANVFSPLPGATNHIYMGELLRRQGKHAEAEKELRDSLVGKPNRVSAWLNLALIAASKGNEEEQHAINERIWRLAPGLLWDVAQGLGIKQDQQWQARGELWEEALRLMRGNRSSHLVTFFTKNEDFRILPRVSKGSLLLRQHWDVVAGAHMADIHQGRADS